MCIRDSNNNSDGLIKVWAFDGNADFPTPTILSMPESTQDVVCVEWAPNGKRIATISRNQNNIFELKLWNSETSELIGSSQLNEEGIPPSIVAVGWNPQGSRLLVVKDPRIMEIWNLSGTKILSLPIDFAPNSLTWSPDGMVLTASYYSPEFQPSFKNFQGSRGGIQTWGADPWNLDINILKKRRLINMIEILGQE